MQRNKAFQSFELKAGNDSPEGSIRAVFSTFDVPDRDGDVVRASAFTDGQRVPMVWAHDWTQPVGDGVVKVEKGRAVFDGRFWLDTIDGEQAYKRVKNAGDLQEYSWGFRILEHANNSDVTGYDITKAEVFEVSPVLVGANQYTETLAVKALDAGEACPACGHVEDATSTQDDPPAEPEWAVDARLASAAAALEVANAYSDAA